MPRKTKQNNITSSELIAQVSPENIRLKKDYLAYLESLQRSPGTVKGYSNDLDIFFVWNLQNNSNKLFPRVTKRDLVSFQHWLLNTNNNSPARVRRIKSTISSLSNFIENVLDDEEEFSQFRSIILKIESPVKQPVREKTVLTEEQLETLLKHLASNKQYEKACMLALAMYSGRRKSELVRFKTSDFKPENLICGGALYKTSETVKTKGFGLGKYIYCYTLSKKFHPYLEMWLEYRKANEIDSIWLFPHHASPDNQLNPSTLNSWALTFSNFLGVDFYWHSLRHYFTTGLSRSGLPDNIIQEIVGWSSADMVKIYKNISTEEQIEQYFNENGIRTDVTKSISDL